MINQILSCIKSLYFAVRQTQIRVREILFAKTPIDIKRIPIIINNFNRLSCLSQLISRLERDNYTNIYIIDNKSTYPPLLEYYADCPYNIIRLEQNVGYLSLWQTDIYKQFKNQYFVYTDPDVVPDQSCPSDYIEYFFALLKKYPRASKVGFSLRIDNLPDTFKNKSKVVDWESKFWTNQIADGNYKAAIDTTFALYRPNVKGGAYYHDVMIRTGSPYCALHLPWYNDDSNPTDEDKYYMTNAKTLTHWTSSSQQE